MGKYIQDNRENDGLAMSPGSAINQMSVNGLEKKFLDEVDGYAQGKNHIFNNHDTGRIKSVEIVKTLHVISGVFYCVHFKQMDRQIHAQYGYVLTVTSELH